MKFDVLREHYGDRFYVAGETREAEKSSVAHLLRSGVLAEKAAKSVPNKAAPAHPNKAKTVPDNKAKS
ncbi:hypothetical protein [Paracoccus sp. J39]|uniref:hypothetical protein n=1 Tax=Paracoccus sp. J39 TaxID=935848 RepID=UPI0004917FF6|nr:hypothetical protein [Paracoccus sp. J39]